MIRIRVGGPLEPYRAGIEGELDRLGYSQGRSTMLMLLVAHVSAWIDQRHLGPSECSPTKRSTSSSLSGLLVPGADRHGGTAHSGLPAGGRCRSCHVDQACRRHADPRWCFGSRSAGGAWTSEG